MLIKDEAKAAAEALLFVQSGGLTGPELADILDLSLAEVEEIMAELSRDYTLNHRGMQIAQNENGYVMCTRTEFAGLIRRLHKPVKKKLSPAALETLAVIAYQQPVTKNEIERIRGVRIDKVLNNLLDRELIVEAGHKEVLGRPVLYATTSEFLKLFGLLSIKDLPPLEESQ